MAEEARKRRVLVVEDDPKFARLVQEYLELAGFSVVLAPDGEAALMKAEEEPPDAVVLDLALPKRSGLEVCLALRGVPRFQRIPIVLFTGKEHEDVLTSFGTNEQLLREWKADAYIHKFDGPAALVKQITLLLWKNAQGSSPDPHHA